MSKNEKRDHLPDATGDRRDFLRAAGAGVIFTASGSVTNAGQNPPTRPESQLSPPAPARPFITSAGNFVDVSRGNPRPYTLTGDALIAARLTAESWRLEIVSDGTASVSSPRTIADNNALDLRALENIGRQHSCQFLKAMQCLNIAQPLGQGLWEGVPLRELIKPAGPINNIRRVYYWGFHNNDPQQLFQSSLSYTQVMETAPGELAPFVAYRLNGQPIPLHRGGPVRLIVPWAHGFKSIKWLQRIILSNAYQANDTYHAGNNDVESHLKTAAYVDAAPPPVRVGQPVRVTGTVMVGMSGVKRVEYWLRPGNGNPAPADNDPAWANARWSPCLIEAPPQNWGATLPQGVLPASVFGFDSRTGQPRDWPMKYSWGLWSATLTNLRAGSYEFRARAVDNNDFAQPEPRPYPKSGRNEVQMCRLTVQA